jgi:hypothetical protein
MKNTGLFKLRSGSIQIPEENHKIVQFILIKIIIIKTSADKKNLFYYD